MKLAKAIELNEDTYVSLKDQKRYDHADATLLGVEAMKHLLSARKHFPLEDQPLLPGETKGDQNETS